MLWPHVEGNARAIYCLFTLLRTSGHPGYRGDARPHCGMSTVVVPEGGYCCIAVLLIGQAFNESRAFLVSIYSGVMLDVFLLFNC